MIVAKTGNSLRLISQPDHAHLAAKILALWRRDGLPESGYREDLFVATREHDNGWLEADSAPRIDPASGRPFDYLNMPDAPRQEIWRRGVTRWQTKEPFASLLIVEHAISLHRGRSGADWGEFMLGLGRLRDTLAEETEADPAEVALLVGLLQLADRLSLEACGGSGGRGAPSTDAGASTASRHWRQGGYQVTVQVTPDETNPGQPDSEARIALDPLPLAGKTTFEVASRRIPDRYYTGGVDLGAALAKARWERTRVRIGPATS